MMQRPQGPFWLDPRDPDPVFPPVHLALRDPDGLLAVGGDLSPRRLLRAYRQGIFPWYSEGQPILWWSPDPRCVLLPEDLHVSRSLRKTLRRSAFKITLDQAFESVINACSEPRRDGNGTWLTPEMRDAYIELHNRGHAHSVEAWEGNRLAGGLYGLALGRAFFGESMFSRVPDASKVAFARLVQQLRTWDFGLIDCQVQSDHLARFGAAPMPRERFLALLERHCDRPGIASPWRMEEHG